MVTSSMGALPMLKQALWTSLAKDVAMPHGAWYLVASATLAVLNRPREIQQVFTYALSDLEHSRDGPGAHKEKLEVSRRIRESLVKTSAIAGLPKSINALMSLKQVTPQQLLDDEAVYSSGSRLQDLSRISQEQILYRGQSFFDKLYGKLSRRVMRQMDQCGTRDLGVIARLAYGHVLSNTSILTPMETSFVLIAGLIPQDVNPQLKGHLRGAINLGASVEQVRAVRAASIKVCEACGMKRLRDDDSVAKHGWRDEIADI
ncbi:AhpD-like protein [Microdochium trichocladiopsis]|uniref:AhpD-like protein n=1 Tax=Microdochium trichocladiopsis TaxID=1682393 RepID=A0A9P8Y815_9PEZI|nr:AhpD-like protein [Microdochium trichocladiopsis]KAH7032884.1 AhpD-like protein [Microdochium trichocladiopsis]